MRCQGPGRRTFAARCRPRGKSHWSTPVYLDFSLGQERCLVQAKALPNKCRLSKCRLPGGSRKDRGPLWRLLAPNHVFPPAHQRTFFPPAHPPTRPPHPRHSLTLNLCSARVQGQPAAPATEVPTGRKEPAELARACRLCPALAEHPVLCRAQLRPPLGFCPDDWKESRDRICQTWAWIGRADPGDSSHAASATCGPAASVGWVVRVHWSDGGGSSVQSGPGVGSPRRQ